MVETLLRPASDAFLQVGVWVGALLGVVALVRARWGRRVERWLADHRRLGPLVGGMLGVSPGCGGAIVVVPLYLRGEVTFGTVVATLTATMGDSSFVLLSTAPTVALQVHTLLLVTGVVSGALVDLIGVDPRSAARDRRDRRHHPAPPRPAVAGSTVGAAAGVTDLTGGMLVRFPSPTLLAFWGLLAVGFALAAPLTLGGVAPGVISIGGVDLPLVVGLIGSLACVGLTVSAGRRVGTECARPGHGLRPALLEAARETAFVTAWVAAAFVVWQVALTHTGWNPAALPSVGLVGVAAGALVGLVPGCGPQILLTGLFARGAIGFPMLVANALSQDGDALFPLLAYDRRSAVWATALTTAPALAVGALLVGLGVGA